MTERVTDRQVMKEFIEIYRSEPCLWKMQSKAYHNRHLKQVAYSKLVEKLKLIDPTANRETVVRKINNLRSIYRREYKKMLKMRADHGDSYVPSLWYFEDLQFLNAEDNVSEKKSIKIDSYCEETVEKTMNQCTTESDSEDSESTIFIKAELEPDCQTVPKSKPILSGYNSVSQTEPNPISARDISTDSQSSTSRPATPPGKKYKNDAAQEFLTSMTEHFKKPPKLKEDDRFDIFGKNVAAKLRDIENKTQRILAEKMINDALFEAEMGSLTSYHSVIGLSTTNMTERQVMTEFIELYKSQPCLWMMRNNGYRNRDIKHAAYSKLVEKLKIIEPTADHQTVMRKINSLRRIYRGEYKKLQTANINGDSYEPTLWYFKLLQFLDEQEQEVSKTTNGNTDSVEIVGNIVDKSRNKYTTNSGSENSVKKRNKKRDYSTNTRSPTDSATTPSVKKYKNDIAHELLTSMSEHFQWAPEMQLEDNFDVLGKIIAAKLRNMENRNQRILAEKMINDALFEAEMGTLTQYHSIINIT